MSTQLHSQLLGQAQHDAQQLARASPESCSLTPSSGAAGLAFILLQKGSLEHAGVPPRATTFWKDPSLSFVQKVPVGHSGSTAPSQTRWRKREFGKGEQRPEIEFGTHRKTEAFGNTKGHSFISMQNYTLLFEEVDEIGAAGSPPTTSPDAH